MNMRCRWIVGPLFCMLALSAVLTAQAADRKGRILTAADTGTAPLQSGSETGAVESDIRQSGLVASDILMEVTYGYDNHAKGGRYVPVDVSFENTGDSDFAGAMEILTMESDYDIYQYQYPVEIAAGTSASSHVYIPMGNRADQMFVSLSDKEGNQILHKRLRLDFSLEVPELFVGILSDTPEKLAAWNGLNIDYSMMTTRAVDFDTETFPEDETGLDMMDVILISNFRIRDLSQEQSRVLIQWVRSGGTMILGTGMRADDTLGRFAPELLEESYDPPGEREVDMGAVYAHENPSDAVLTLPCVDFSLSGGDVLWADEEQTLVATVPYGKGTIAVAAYDFTDMEEFCKQNPSYLDNLLTGILGEAQIGSLAQAVYSGNSDQYWSVRDMINTGNVRRLPNLMLYTLEIVIYIFLAGLILYVFLKQRELTHFYKRGVAALSLFFTAIIYFMSGRTRFTDTFYTYARFMETTSDSVSETTYMNIRAPYNRAYEVYLSPEYAVKPITRSYYNESTSVPRFTGSEDYRVNLSRGQEQTVLTIQNVPAFEPRYFQMDKMTENTEGIGFYGELEVDRGKLYGSITNSFAETVENCTLLFNNKLICVGDMEPGQTIEVDSLEMEEYPQNYSYQVASFLSGKSSFEQADISNEAYVDAAEKTNLLEFYLDNYMPYYTTPSARIAGITRTRNDREGLLQADTVQGITVVSSTVAVYSKDEEVLYRSALVKSPRVLSGSYDQASNSLYGVDPVTLEYSLGNDVRIESLFFDYVSPIFTESQEYAGDNLAVFSGDIYFYNHNSGAYDEMDSEKKEYEGYELADYLSPGNTITVRYVYSNMNQYNWNVLLPMLNIVGREY